MKKLLLLIAILVFSKNLYCQGLIGTPTSLILVYNNPNNYFYIEIQGIDKKKTEKKNIFIIDKRGVQVLAINKYKFLPKVDSSKSQIDILKVYIKWESDYIDSAFNFDIKATEETLRTPKGKEVVFWTYDWPLKQEPTRTDSTITNTTQKQMFILRVVKDYVVGINTPLFESDQYENNKAYLLNNIDNIVESDKEIDLDELNKQVNKQ